MYIIPIFILFCNIFTNSFVFSYNNLLRQKNIIIYCKHHCDNTKNPKYNIISDDNMPILYAKVNDNISKNNLYSLEHIFPISYMINDAKIDMHNLFKTTRTLNNARSNYKYSDYEEYIIYQNNTWLLIINDINTNDWIELENENFVNHKKKLFIPSDKSKGIISRALLYITFKYKFDLDKIINIDTLIGWYLKYPPTNSEKYHNNYVKKIQYNDNKFISSYKTNIKMLRKNKNIKDLY
tara:strand:- start:2848 stop:3561 length:714 start_codon:yes stop_codon:yes gene_type:complete